MWIVVCVIFAAVSFVYLTNIGQLVHGSADPTWFERVGRRRSSTR